MPVYPGALRPLVFPPLFSPPCFPCFSSLVFPPLFFRPFAVGTTIADRPPHRSVRAELPHTAPTSDDWRQDATWRTPLGPWDTRSPLSVGLVPGAASFSLVCALPSTTSAEAVAPLFGRFTGVGSEVARLRAGHRPPLKLYVQFSRIQLSRRLTLPRCNRRDQLNQVHQPVLAVQLGFRQLPPATVPPSLESLRPNAPHNPAVEPVEELSDVGSLVVMAPSPQHRIQFLNQLLGLERHAPPGKRAYLIHESPDRFLPRDRVQRPRLSTTADLPRRQLKLLTAFDLVPKKLESLPHVHNPRLLRMQLHAQFVQNPKRRGHCLSRLCCRLAGCYPVVGVPRELISFAPHLLIERRQKDVAEQG